MELEMSPLLQAKPLPRYPEPKYPVFGKYSETKPTTGALEPWMRRLLRGAMAAAVTVGSGGVFMGCVPMGAPADYDQIPGATLMAVSEADARAAVMEVFAKHNLAPAADVEVLVGALKFEADGYDSQRRIGFEYESASDYIVDTAIETTLKEWRDANGPFFLMLETSYYDSAPKEGTADEARQAALDGIRQSVEAFFDGLAKDGII
jgi:hypothetical protein